MDDHGIVGAAADTAAGAAGGKAADMISALGELDEEGVLTLASSLLSAGTDKLAMLRLLKEGLERVGALYEKGEYFIADLIVSGSIYKSVLELPGMRYEPREGEPPKGRIVLGTAEGDVHDIGKDILKGVLSANGFEIVDLGTDVNAKAFVEAVREIRPDILAMSGVLTIAVSSMEKTVAALAEAGLRDSVKVIVGGMCMTQELSRAIGADAYAEDPFKGLSACLGFVGLGSEGRSDGPARVS